jgi:hypothetical protein
MQRLRAATPRHEESSGYLVTIAGHATQRGIEAALSSVGWILRGVALG